MKGGRRRGWWCIRTLGQPLLGGKSRSLPQIYHQNYCQNPNSTNNSIELNLRLDYILTESSPCPPTTNSRLLLLFSAPASQAGKLYSSTVRVQCSHYVFVAEFKTIGQLFNEFNTKKIQNYIIGKKRSRSTGPYFVQMLPLKTLRLKTIKH
jgi:hypothetical protein